MRRFFHQLILSIFILQDLLSYGDILCIAPMDLSYGVNGDSSTTYIDSFYRGRVETVLLQDVI